MKKYAKPQMMAKNAPTGSYAAGCPSKNQKSYSSTVGCKACERTY